MLRDFSWNMTGYIREKDLRYFSFFLHHYEPHLNKRIKTFLCADGGIGTTRPVSGYKAFLP